MTQILGQMSDAVGSFASLPIVQVGLQLIGAYVVILWLGAAFWAYRDMRRRTSDVLAPFGSAGLVVAFTPLFFPAAFLVHLILRPPETLEERSEHELRRSILEAEAVGTVCPACSAVVADDWLLCPSCATRLRRLCPECDRLVELTWDICAFCGRDFRPQPGVLASEPAAAMAAPAATIAATGADVPRSLSGRRQPAPTRNGGPHIRRRVAAPAPMAASLSTASSSMRLPSDG